MNEDKTTKLKRFDVELTITLHAIGNEYIDVNAIKDALQRETGVYYTDTPLNAVNDLLHSNNAFMAGYKINSVK